MKRLAAFPALATAAVLFVFVFAVVRADGGIGNIAGLKLVGVTSIAILAGYFAWSAMANRLVRLNNLVLVNGLLCLAGAELVLRVMADRLPPAIVVMLPAISQGKLLADRGLFAEHVLRGDGLLYSWRAGLRFEHLPWIDVDRNGYRNRKVAEAPDMVILGDSVTIAHNVRQDLGVLLARDGLSTLNLGFSGYGPLHQRDAYLRYVIEPELRHRFVLINFCFCNDVTDAVTYRRIAAIGGTWRDYLGRSPNRTAFPFPFEPPWSVSVLFNLPYVLVQQIRNLRAVQSRALKISLPRGTVDAAGWYLPPDGAGLTDAQWSPAIEGLGNILSSARVAGANAILAYYPNLPQIYLSGLVDAPDIRAAARRDHVDAVTRLRRLAEAYGAAFIDYTAALHRANLTRRVTVVEGDYHPNREGVRIMAEEVRRLLGTAP